MKPFKTNDSWFHNKYFFKFVEDEWKSIEVEGRSNLVIKEKLKALKVILKKWIK